MTLQTRELPVRRIHPHHETFHNWPPRAYSFTTIDPQRAIGYLQIDCACKRFNLTDKCRPNYGGCTEGRRSVPIELLDVAGLVPGAHEGKGLGNKFLDDLRHADALIHVVDVSGTTDAEGQSLVSLLGLGCGYWRNNRKGDSRVWSIARYCMAQIGDCTMGSGESDGEMVCLFRPSLPN